MSPSVENCSSGSPNTYIYQPVLPVGGSYTNPVENTGCYILLETQYK